MNKKTIIILEDDTELSELFRVSLESAGFHVIVQSNSRDICDLIDQHKADLVITDMVMPEYEGMEGIVKVVNQYNVPIIAISQHAEYLHVVETIVTMCLQKPITTDRLLQTVSQILQ